MNAEMGEHYEPFYRGHFELATIMHNMQWCNLVEEFQRYFHSRIDDTYQTNISFKQSLLDGDDVEFRLGLETMFLPEVRIRLRNAMNDLYHPDNVLRRENAFRATILGTRSTARLAEIEIRAQEIQDAHEGNGPCFKPRVYQLLYVCDVLSNEGGTGVMGE